MNLSQKVGDLSLVLIKISVYVRRRELRERLERLAFDLIEQSAVRNFDEILKIGTTLEHLIQFAGTIYEIEPVNMTIVMKMVHELNAAIRQLHEGLLPDSEKPSLDLSFFAERGLSIVPRKNRSDQKRILRNEKPAEDVKDIADMNPAMESGNGSDNAAIRQSAIFQRIKDLAGESIQLKDVITFFPGVSERTLRYDLQRLSAEGKIERIGQGGPATYYKVRVV